MHWSALLVAVCGIVAVTGEEGKRLIDFGNGAEVWMTEEQVSALASRPGVKGGFMDITEHPKAHGVADWQQGLSRWAKTTPIPANNTYYSPKRSSLTAYVDKLAAYHTRYYTTQTGKDAAEWVHSELTTLADGRNDVSVNFFNHAFLQPSVIARVEGTGSAQEICIVGGHVDSTAGAAGSRAPGADDDGTGTASVMEVFRQLMAAGWRPARPVEFHAYAAEEVGLRGSADIASAYVSEMKPVRSMLQLDMTAYRGNSGMTVGVITDFTDNELTKRLTEMLSQHTTLIPQDSTCGYACSDHGSWTRNGYPAAFIFETPFGQHNPSIHTAGDTTDKIDLAGKGEEFIKLAMAYIEWCSQ